MKRRGFLTAIAGLFAWPVISKVKVKTVENTWLRDMARQDGILHNIFPVEEISERDALNDRIEKAVEWHYLTTGVYPNSLLLGNKEYYLWTEGHPEILGKGWDGTSKTGEDITAHYVTAHNMLVYAKMRGYGRGMRGAQDDQDRWDLVTVDSHLEVQYNENDKGNDRLFDRLFDRIMETRGFKV